VRKCQDWHFRTNSDLSKYFQFYKSIKVLPGLGYNALGSDSTAVNFIEQIARLICAREGKNDENN